MINSSNYTGGIVIIVLLSALFTLVISFFLLRLYRRSVIKVMGKMSQPIKTQPSGKRSIDHQHDQAPGTSHPEREVSMSRNPSYKEVKHQMYKVVLTYIAGGLVYAAVLSLAWSFAAENTFVLIRFLVMLVCFSWPIIVTVWLVYSPASGKFFVAYVAIFTFLCIVAGLRNPDVPLVQLVFLWLLMNGPVTLLLIIISNRKIRSVGPLVFAFTITALTGAYLIVDLFSKSEGLMYFSASVASLIGANAREIIAFFVIAGLVLFAPLGWLILKWIGRRYKEKKMSDQSLTLDALWFIFGFFQSFSLVTDDFKLAFTGIAAFIAFKITVRIVRSLTLGKISHIRSDRILLLLRVFALGKKSESLFDATISVWLRNGSMCMLSGPDLATSTLEPHEFYDFIGGRLARQFVHDEQDLQQKTSNIDLLPDPDGRYRINEFFCMANTWQNTMQRLAEKCSVVLMDLRSFSEKNRASTFELTHLLNAFPAGQIVLLTDPTTDLSFLKTTIGLILGNGGNSTINKGLGVNDLHILEFRQNSRAEMRKLHELLFV